MNYQTFKDFLITHLWKKGDTYVINALDTLVLTAHVELERVLREVPEREKLTTVTVTTLPWPLPSDCHRIRAVSRKGARGGMKYVAPNEYFELEDGRVTNTQKMYYSVVDNNLLLPATAVSATSPLEVNLWYEAKIPDFKADDTSWVADKFFDLYLYSVLKHTAPFLREDERLQVWAALYQAALDSVIEDGADRKFTGSPLHLQWNGTIR